MQFSDIEPRSRGHQGIKKLEHGDDATLSDTIMLQLLGRCILGMLGWLGVECFPASYGIVSHKQ